MKLHEIEIENFGIFSGRRFEFAPGLQPIHGQNEAGKSTLLELIRQALFGFAHQNPFAFSVHDGEMAATICACLDDGRQLRIRRRKGRGSTVQGRFEPDGAPIDEATWGKLLGDAGRDLYRNVFGFSLEELSSGEKSLTDANLNEALFGGALGGLANLQELRQGIRKDQRKLFTARSRSAEIDVLLAKLRDQERSLRQIVIKPRDYAQLRLDCEQRESEASQLGQQLVEMRHEQARLTQIAGALPSWVEREEFRRELESLQLPERVPNDLAERYQGFRERVSELDEDLATLDAQLASATQEQENLPLAPQLMEAEAEIAHLRHDSGRIRALRSELATMQEEMDGRRHALLAQLHHVDPDWSIEQLDRFKTSLAQRTELERLCAELDEIERVEESLRIRQQSLQRDLSGCRQQIESLGDAPDNSALAAAIDHQPKYENDARAMEELVRSSERLELEIETLRQKLNAPLDQPISVPERLSPPMETTVVEFRQRFEQIDGTLDRLEHRLSSARQDLEHKRHELTTVDAQIDVPDRDQLEAQRARREAGWQLIRRRYIRGKSVDAKMEQWLLDEDISLPDAYEREVRRADEMADRRQTKAELVARQEQLEVQVSLAERQVGRANTEMKNTRAERAVSVEAWNSLWSACNLRPLSPEAMLDWLRLHDRLVDKCAEHEFVQRQLRDLGDRIGDFDDELAAVVPQQFSGTVEQRLVEAKRLLDEMHQARAQRASLESQLPIKEAELAELVKEEESLRQRRDRWDAERASLMELCDFPPTWNIRAAVRVAQGLGEAQAIHKQVRSLQERREQAKVELAEFDEAVAQLGQRLVPDLGSLPADDAVVRLGERLDAAVEAQRRHQSLQEQHRGLTTRHQSQSERRAELQSRVSDLMQVTGAANEDELQLIAAAARRRHECQNEITRLTHQVNTIANSQQLDTFEQSLREADATDVKLRLSEIARQLDELQAEYDEAQQRAGIARSDLARIDGTSKAVAMQLDVENTRRQLSDAIDRWAPLVLADALLERGIESFERQHQPAMLENVQQLLKRMTGGRYVAVRRRLDEHNTTEVGDANGHWKEPRQLSRGTREQLYLASRLSYVMHYCDTSESLPMVMDDVLVNFDDRRARQTLEALVEISESVQILFLTCHQSIVDRMKQISGIAEPILLDVAEEAHVG